MNAATAMIALMMVLHNGRYLILTMIAAATAMITAITINFVLFIVFVFNATKIQLIFNIIYLYHDFTQLVSLCHCIAGVSMWLVFLLRAIIIINAAMNAAISMRILSFMLSFVLQIISISKLARAVVIK